MFRWWKILLWLAFVAVIALATLPWWLGVALRPILKAQRVTFERYERVGYSTFKLHNAQYLHPSVVIMAKEVQADTPLLWLAQRLRGGEPLITVNHWLIRHTPSPDDPSSKRVLNGMADLQRLLIRLVPILHHWLPKVHLQTGELRAITPEMTFHEADWHDSILKVNGLGIIGRELTAVIAPGADNSFAISAETPDKEAQLKVVWSAPEIKGGGTWWNQPVELNGRYAATGWLPAEADVATKNWLLPASRLKLGAPYARVRGDGHASWREGAFELALNAKAEPAAGTKAPPFEAQATAHGNLHELTVTALHVDAPFATASLSAPVTFSVDHPLSAGAAQLTLKADLAKLPWIDAHGRAQGSVTVTGDATNSKQTFQLEFNEVVLQNYSIEKAQVRGVLQWPLLKLEQCDVQLDKTGSVTARGSVDWQTRELSGVTLEGKVGPAWFARWLPKNISWTAAEIDATAEGSLDAPRHRGTLKMSQLNLKPLQPAALEAAWQGTGAKIEIESARATAGGSSLEFAGTLDPRGIKLSALAFAPHGQVAWKLAAPAHFTWFPTWQIDNLQLAGPDSNLSFKGKGGADGFVDFNVTSFDSAWLQDWISVTGPHWQVHALQANGHVANGTLAFDTTLTAQIEMQPRPAEVKLSASGDGGGVQLKELTVIESNRVLTKASGRLPFSWKIFPAMQVSFDENAPLELSASTDPDSPLWSALSAYTGLKLTKPEAKIELKGTLRDPSGEVRMNATQLSVSEGRFKFSLPEFADLALALQLGRKTVTLTNLSTKLDGQSLQASGQLPMDDARWQELWHDPKTFDWSNATAQVEIPDADLAMLGRHFPTFVAPKGRLHAKVELKSGGKFSGELHLTDAASRPLPPFSTLQEINADLVLADRTLTIQTLTGKIGGQPVTVDGSVILVPGAAPRLALGLKGKNLPLVRNTGLLVRNDVDLHANTDAAGVTRISGVVTLRDCLVLANLSSLLPTGQRGVTRQPPYFAVDAEPFRAWPLAVEVRGQQAVRIRTTVFNGTASARFQLSGTLGEPRAVGELTVDQGQVLFPFATFAVQTGTVRLREADPFHATVNLNATSQRRDYQLRLEVTGQLPSPNILLSSTPVLEAEDVLLMVMTGQPPTNTEVTVSSAGQRLALLGAYLGRGIFQDLGFGGEDRLEISAGEQVSLQGRETYDFEYKLDKRWSLTGEYDRFDSYNAGLKWRVYTEESKPVEKKGKFNQPMLKFTASLWCTCALIFACISLCTLQLSAAELQVKGLGWFGNRTAEQRLKLLLGSQSGATLDANALEDAALVLISSVNEEGYLEPALTVQVTLTDGRQEEYPLDAKLEHSLPRPLNATVATLQLDRGKRFSLQEVTFAGLLAVTEKEARGFFIGEGLLIRLASERIYSPGRLQRAQNNLEEALRQQGYAEVAVTAGNVQIDHATGKVRAEIKVQEGRQWIVNNLNFVITDKTEAPPKLAGAHVGQRWTSLWRQDTATAIRRWYYARGHPDVQVKLTPQATDAADGTKAVSVLAEVTPGPVVRIGEIKISGNTHTREKTLRRLVPAKTGDLLNPIRLDNGQARISQLGVFRSVDLRYTPPDAEVRDVDYTVTEGRRQELSLLGGYGSYEQLRGGIEWRHYNLFDRAHTDDLKLIQSMKSSQGDYIYTVPELFGTTTDGSVHLFALNRQEFSFRREEYGANVSVLWPLRRLGVQLTTGYTFKHLRNAENELATRATDSNQADISSIDIGLVRDKRDNPLRPTKGYKLSAQIEAANRALGGEVVYQQIILAASYHTNWGNGRWIHAGISHGFVTTLGAPDDSTLPVSVRFYPGGDGSIRGYQKGEAAPREANGEFVGAKSYVQLNLELEQALTAKWSVVAFGDALGIAARMSDYPFSEKLYSVGLGIRYQTIIGPVRLEYGHNLNPRPFDPAGTLQLSIGFPF